MNKVNQFLLTVILVIGALALGIWGYNQLFQRNVIATRTLPPISQPATTTPTQQPTQWKSDKDFPGPSIMDAKRMLGVDVVRVGTEYSCFNWRGIPNATEVKLNKEFIFTLHLTDDRVVVILGNDKVVKAKGFTARHLASYPASDAVHQPLILAEKESHHMMGNVVFVTDI